MRKGCSIFSKSIFQFFSCFFLTESTFVLGHQANLKETSEGKELAELILQVLVVVKTSDACEPKKEIMRLKSVLQREDRGACY
jgi:hypothetical protein